jgi:hypothetical protein
MTITYEGAMGVPRTEAECFCKRRVDAGGRDGFMGPIDGRHVRFGGIYRGLPNWWVVRDLYFVTPTSDRCSIPEQDCSFRSPAAVDAIPRVHLTERRMAKGLINICETISTNSE